MARFIKKKVIYDSIDEELQLQTSVRYDGGGGGVVFDAPRRSPGTLHS